MSDAVSPLNHATFEGFVRVEAMGLHGMITLRGDLATPAIKNAGTGITGTDMPDQGRQCMNGDHGLAWMSPDELLLFVPYAEAETKLKTLQDNLAGKHFLAVNVSDARAMLRIEGDGVREVIAKLCPVDMSAEAFGPGDFRRTRMGQIPAAFWMPTDTSVQIVCFRSVAEYAFNLLKDAAEPGSEVGFYG